MDHAIRTRRLTKRFRHHLALSELNLDVPAGVVFGVSRSQRRREDHDDPAARRADPADVGLGDRLRFRRRGSVRTLLQRGSATSRATSRRTPISPVRSTCAISRTCAAASTGRDRPAGQAVRTGCRGRIGTLSHGNRQKIGIIQAFMHEPDLLILDEPTPDSTR